MICDIVTLCSCCLLSMQILCTCLHFDPDIPTGLVWGQYMTPVSGYRFCFSIPFLPMKESGTFQYGPVWVGVPSRLPPTLLNLPDLCQQVTSDEIQLAIGKYKHNQEFQSLPVREQEIVAFLDRIFPLDQSMEEQTMDLPLAFFKNMFTI